MRILFWSKCQRCHVPAGCCIFRGKSLILLALKLWRDYFCNSIQTINSSSVLCVYYWLLLWQNQTFPPPPLMHFFLFFNQNLLSLAPWPMPVFSEVSQRGSQVSNQLPCHVVLFIKNTLCLCPRTEELTLQGNKRTKKDFDVFNF